MGNYRDFQLFKELFLLKSDRDSLINLMHLSIASDGIPVYTAAEECKKHTYNYLKKESEIVNATVPTVSLAVTSDGILTENVSTSVTCTYSQLQIRKRIYLSYPS